MLDSVLACKARKLVLLGEFVVVCTSLTRRTGVATYT